jgi:hypothetical protein
MIRPTRSAALLLAFSLLTSATTASAECAWLLWNGAIRINHWQIQGVHQTAAECNRPCGGSGTRTGDQVNWGASSDERRRVALTGSDLLSA